ncbi:hypothetical protein BpHYR1_043264 [Brachionus plicatilis]|uniref:Uncharacterized protein n=1 Tax=Brachionus plicatilis TaxID=10195 RepID=A0A3M7P9L0_BRAPC|nr:hypothetical protein BpHYR1_043264 [Brachionus plicatilis]
MILRSLSVTAYLVPDLNNFNLTNFYSINSRFLNDDLSCVFHKFRDRFKSSKSTSIIIIIKRPIYTLFI